MKVKDIINAVYLDEETPNCVNVWDGGELIFCYKGNLTVPKGILNRTVKAIFVGYFCIGLEV